MVARLLWEQDAAGSNPVTRTKPLKSLRFQGLSFFLRFVSAPASFTLLEGGRVRKMARKRIQMNTSTMTLAEVFPRFLTSKTAQAVSEKTLKPYRWHFHCIGKHLDLEMSFAERMKEHLERFVIWRRKRGLSHNSISSYMRVAVYLSAECC